MSLSLRKKAFIELGKFLKFFSLDWNRTDFNASYQPVFYTDFKQALSLSQLKNGWFTEENLKFCMAHWAEVLTDESIQQWINGYTFDSTRAKNILIVMAGNIPLVGFHDFLSVLISGHRALIKCSSNDEVLLPVLSRFLISICPEFEDKITFIKEYRTDFDAVIATGSNNTARYFEYYFGNKPHIIRRNRNSVAILHGNETPLQLTELGKDIFQYFGLGCRCVSKIFVPKDYDFTAFFEAMFSYRNIIEHKKYENNYEYNKAVYLMSLFPLRENGFLLLKEDTQYASPIATLFYEFYSDEEQLRERISNDRQKIQCIVGQGFFLDEIPFGKTQYPQLDDYADQINTLDFLNSLS